METTDGAVVATAKRRPGRRPAAHPLVARYVLLCSEDHRSWFDGLLAHLGSTDASATFRAALAEHAVRVGYHPPPPPR